MIGADIVRHLFALRDVGPFGALGENELLLIARQARFRSFAPGQVVIAANSVAETLLVRVTGSVETASGPVPEVFDAPSVLFGLAARADYCAGPAGLGALVLAKPHVFTIARECPEFIVALLDPDLVIGA